MAFRSSKHRQVQPLMMSFGGGVNLYDAPQNVPDGQCAVLNNWLYLHREAVPSVRTGLQCIAAPPTGLSITKLQYYQKNATSAFTVAAMSNGNLYWLDGDEWVYFAPLASAGITPCMVVFNGLLVVADGSSTLHAWNGRDINTSATSMVVEIGSKSFVLDVDEAWASGENIVFTHGINKLFGTVTTYTQLTKTVLVNVTRVEGSGTYTSWDVSGYLPILNSPQATAIIEAQNRLVCNSAQDLDGVYFSGPEDELDWDTGNSGSASFYRAGYRDALSVTGFGVFGSDLLVFKQGPDGGRIYRIGMGAAQPWDVVALSKNVTATSQQCIEWVQNNVLFGADTGVMDIGGVIQYGDLEVGSVGRLINPILQGKNLLEIRFLPSLGVAMCLVDGDYRVLVYHPHNNAWSVLDFQQMFFSTCCQAGGDVLLAGKNGYLYRLSVAEDRDETTPSVFSDYQAVLRTRTVVFEAEEVIRQTRLYFESITESLGKVSYLGLDSPDPSTLIDIDTQVGLGQLYDANGYLNDATEMLGAFTVDYIGSHDRARDAALAFEIRTTSGRIKARQLYVSLATVNG